MADIMSADFPFSDDLASYVAERIATDPGFKGTLEDAEEARRLVDSLIALRKQCRVSQVDVAKRMGVRQPTVSGFEKEPSDPKLSTLQRYARALDARLRLVLEIPTGSAAPTWRQSPYVGNARGETRRFYANPDKTILKKMDWSRAGVVPARDGRAA
ncbi:antitoxin HigA [Mycobacteroides abscessus]|nr:antitoxin HigA [Mycobacteroides abscessus]